MRPVRNKVDIENAKKCKRVLHRERIGHGIP